MSSKFNKRNKRVARACYLAVIANTLTMSAHAQKLSETAVRAWSSERGLAEDRAQFAEEEGPGEPARYGPFDIRYSFRGSAVYDDNIFIRPNKEGDVVWTATPGIMLSAGDYRVQEENLLSLQYTPSFVVFTENSGQNAVDHEAWFMGQAHPGPLLLNLKQGYQNFSGAVVDVGDRVNRQIYTTDLLARYELSLKTDIEVEGRQSINDYDRLLDHNEWVVRGWFDYRWTPLLRVGAGLSAGFVDATGSQNQSYQEALMRAFYSVTELVELRASVGAERREFQGPEDSRTDGIFSVGATYKPLVRTTFLLDGYRRPHTSAIIQNNNYIATGASVGVRQVLLESYSVQLSGGYENADYVRTHPLAPETREDNYWFGRLSLDWQATDHVTVGAFYAYRQNNSTASQFDFDNHQVGLNLNLRF